MKAHWADELIGRPWMAGAEGPRAFDCWGFVRFVEREYFDCALPLIPVDANDLRASLRAFAEHTHGIQPLWHQVGEPREGDAVLLGQGRWGNHVGVWLNTGGGGVLHCERGCGVVYTPRRRLLWPWHRFYRFNAEIAR